MKRFRLTVLVIVVSALSSCRSVMPGGAEGSGRAATRTENSLPFEDEAFLLLMADQLLYEPFGVRRVYQEHPELHARLAATLGRVGDARALRFLTAMLADPNAEVRREAVFALGQIGEQAAYPDLLGALADRDRKAGRLAVQSLARLGISLDRVEAALGILPQRELLERLLPELFRFESSEIDRFVAQLSQELEPDLESWLLYAVARNGTAASLSRLREAYAGADSWTGGWVARGLGRLGDASDLDRLLVSLKVDSEPGPRIQALRAASRLVSDGRAAPSDDWVPALRELFRAQASGLRLTAIEAAGWWPDLEKELSAIVLSERGRAAELALVALARRGGPIARESLARAAADARIGMRRAAAEATGLLGLVQVATQLLRDTDPSVRLAALSTLLEGGAAEAEAAAREALLDSEVEIRAAALEWLSENPVAPIDELLLAIASHAGKRLPDLEVNCARALAKRALNAPLERGAIVSALEEMAKSPEWLVRRAVSESLVPLGRPATPVGTVVTNRILRSYRDIALVASQPHSIELEVTRGKVVFDLECGTAPLTCVAFLKLAAAGFFDGLTFHRVIPDFVAQGGDPAGHGWGGPGFALRDENCSQPFERGVVGMARSDTHTAGSQFFLTMSRQPHLDGSYTIVGRVTEGLSLLDQIEQGDRILAMREPTLR